ncbi:MAG: Ku protein [Alphaproteobacteria bacterium]|nr:Ku protein [Rhizobiaceae bacterium]MBU3961835.1 Ku protein [Alphaproteobacteria bacterium]MBU4050459.1 Ku protein [Alphaproteobacteria bacterium]MBU4091256.1 Ku protein [Alphaproteobacteria bacterium]MBU4158366.1 Ku protein [Alphaproteobacteria bacterium]
MAARAIWRGDLVIGELTCPVALYSAVTAQERVSFHIINRDTGHRVRREYFDADTDQGVDNDDLVKGYETSEGQAIILTPDEIRDAVPNSDKTLEMASFIPCDGIDTVFLERPYYLAPGSRQALEVYDLVREAMAAKGVAALVQTVLFRRVRSLLIRPHGKGMIATTLNFDYEVRPAKDTFGGISAVKIEGEMLELAQHIIETKQGEFDPAEFEDRYEEAVIELVKAKIAGRKPKRLPKRKASNVTDLMEALRKSAGVGGKDEGKRKAPAKRASTAGAKAKSAPKRKAG